METENKNRELKRLGMVRMAAIQAVMCMSNLYDYAKRNSGPLRSTVGTVEGAVTTVVGPVFVKFKDVPDDLLVFLDNKVLHFYCVIRCRFGSLITFLVKNSAGFGMVFVWVHVLLCRLIKLIC